MISAQVLLKTSAGDIDIELWSKEAPKACRNFVQLCMEGKERNHCQSSYSLYPQTLHCKTTPKWVLGIYFRMIFLSCRLLWWHNIPQGGAWLHYSRRRSHRNRRRWRVHLWAAVQGQTASLLQCYTEPWIWSTIYWFFFFSFRMNFTPDCASFEEVWLPWQTLGHMTMAVSFSSPWHVQMSSTINTPYLAR